MHQVGADDEYAESAGDVVDEMSCESDIPQLAVPVHVYSSALPPSAAFNASGKVPFALFN